MARISSQTFRLLNTTKAFLTPFITHKSTLMRLCNADQKSIALFVSMLQTLKFRGTSKRAPLFISSPEKLLRNQFLRICSLSSIWGCLSPLIVLSFEESFPLKIFALKHLSEEGLRWRHEMVREKFKILWKRQVKRPYQYAVYTLKLSNRLWKMNHPDAQELPYLAFLLSNIQAYSKRFQLF